MDRGAWRATVHGVVKSQTRLRLVLHFRSIILLKQQARGTNTGGLGVYLKITYDMQFLCFEKIQHTSKTNC